MRIFLVAIFVLIAIAGGLGGYLSALRFMENSDYEPPLLRAQALQEASRDYQACQDDPERMKRSNCALELSALQQAVRKQQDSKIFEWRAIITPNVAMIYGALPGILLLATAWFWRRRQPDS